MPSDRLSNSCPLLVNIVAYAADMKSCGYRVLTDARRVTVSSVGVVVRGVRRE